MSAFVNPNQNNNLIPTSEKVPAKPEGKSEDYWGITAAGIVFGGVGTIILALIFLAMLFPFLSPEIAGFNISVTLDNITSIIEGIQKAIFMFLVAIAFLHLSGLLLSLVGLGAKHDKHGVQRKRSTSAFMLLWCSAFLSLMVIHYQNLLSFAR